MILVTLGTQDKKFYRLLEAVQKQIDSNVIKERVVVQAGCSSDFKSDDMEIFDLIPMDEFEKLITECDLLITHGGVGSIISGLKNNKKIIAAARLKKYGEHTNDHQLQIIENFSDNGYILNLDDFDKLGELINKSKKFKPKKFESNNQKFVNLLKDKIDNYVNKSTNKKTIINTLFFVLIMLFLIVCSLKSIFKPIDVVQNENRYANKYDKLNLNSYFNGEMQDNFEKTLSDQIPLSSKFKTANNLFDSILMKNTLNLIINNDVYNYYSLGSIYLFGKENLVYMPYELSSYKEELKSRVKSLNKTMDLYPNIDYYFYYIEKDTDINFVNGKKVLAYEYIKDRLNSKNISNFEINNFNDFKDLFYKTDHHWNYKGSYKGYLEVLQLLKLKNPKEPTDERCFKGEFVGSKGQALANVYNEKFCAYTFDFDDIDVYINGKIADDYGNYKKALNGEYTNLSYDGFYGYDEGEIIFDNNDSNKENILIIGESFDNAIIKLLAEKFNKTIAIDLRNYKHYMNKEFNYEEYIEKYEIDKVLFIGNINYYISQEFNVIK